jgi:hypothetical protein
MALGSAALAATPASAVVLVLDTGINPAQKVFTRPVNNTTTLLGNFVLGHGSIIDSIQAYGRILGAGFASFSIFADNGGTPGASVFSNSKFYGLTSKNAYYGPTNLGAVLAAGSYWVGLGQTTAGNGFSSDIRGNAPNPGGLGGSGAEGYIRNGSYIAMNNADLSWRLTGNTIAAVVPEPATWGMMMLGFGLVGGAMRVSRRKVKVTYAAA